MIHTYYPQGVCSYQMDVELDGDIIKKVIIRGGCSGNTQCVSRLVEGMTVPDAIGKLRGISCGGRPTSCPDQLSYALEEAVNQ